MKITCEKLKINITKFYQKKTNYSSINAGFLIFYAVAKECCLSPSLLFVPSSLISSLFSIAFAFHGPVWYCSAIRFRFIRALRIVLGWMGSRPAKPKTFIIFLNLINNPKAQVLAWTRRHSSHPSNILADQILSPPTSRPDHWAVDQSSRA